ncbi:MAG: recombinase family protein [Clostridiales bacterium]|nr:recombinase family protein [Clostridiales bacterium]
MSYCLYLRKSRADAEAEARGEGETLVRHERTLLELAKKCGLVITEIYREIVSGDTIAARPVMQQLLQEVGQGKWKGVLVMEVERLARGDTIDQGIVAQTFKFSGTKIITPIKVYDPSNEYDEEYFEFGLFMSRREYKTINRRLQRGRSASVKEGKFVSGIPPYGYKRVHVQDGKGFTLAVVPEEADVVKLIYLWYTVGEKQSDGSLRRLGVSLIARRLNDLKVPPRKGGVWVMGSIRDILINPVYVGKVRWNWRKCVKRMVNGRVSVTRPRSSPNADDLILADGLHPAIVAEETFALAQEYISVNRPRPVPYRCTVKNPLAGIVVCGVCGRHMVRRPYGNKNQPDTLMCPEPTCKNVSSALYLVEKRLIEALAEWVGQYTVSWDIKPEIKDGSAIALRQKAITRQNNEIATLRNQLAKTHDLLEQGIYDTDTFLSRSRLLSEKISVAEASLKALQSELSVELMRQESAVNIIPKVNNLLEVYEQLSNPKVKNDMLKEVLESVVYIKESGGRWHGSPDNFEIHIYPVLPDNAKAALD